MRNSLSNGKRLVCYFLVLALIFSLVISHPTEIYAAEATQSYTLGGRGEADPLKIIVKNNGDIGLYFWQSPGTYQYQYYSEFSWGSNLFFTINGTSNHYATRYYGPDGSSTKDFGIGSISSSGNSVTVSWDLGGGVYLNQSITYVPGDSYYEKRWRITNNSSYPLGNIKFFHGGDTYFGGADSATSYWNPQTRMVYVRNSDMTRFGMMGFSGSNATPADRYFAGQYSTGITQAKAGDLDNSANNAFVDAGYQLQWNHSTLNVGQNWEIISYERITPPSKVQIMAPSEQSMAPGGTATYEFVVQNFDTTAVTYNLSAVSSRNWPVSIAEGGSINIGSGASSVVHVNVQVPQGTTNSVEDTLTFTAAASNNSASATASTRTICDGVTAAILNVQPDQSTIPGSSASLGVTINTQNVVNGTTFTASLLDASKNPLVPAVAGTGTVSNNTANITLNLPGNLTPGNYHIAVSVPGVAAVHNSTVINVSAVVPPSVTAFTKAGYGDNLLTFTVADFTSNYSDPQNRALNKIQITSLPQNGKLKLSGSDIVLNQEISAANLGSITFVPNANWIGSTSFNWKASNGSAYSASSSATINLSRLLSSNKYIVDSAAGMIFNVPTNERYDTFFNNIATAPGATAALFQSNGTTLINSGDISSGMKVKVTAPGGIIKWFTIKTAAEFYPDEIVVPGQNTGLWNDDIATGALDLGFNFRYFDNSYSTGFISTNGLLSFGSGYYHYSNYNIPNTSIPNNMICAFWDDLVVQNYRSAQDARKTILYKTIGTAPNRKFIAQWTNMYFYSNPTLPMGTFQAILYEGSNIIQLQYRELMGSNLSFGSSATIGLENSAGNSGISYSCNTTSLYTRKAISFTPNGSSYTMDSAARYDPVFLIDTTLPDMPTLISPSNGGSGVSSPVTFTWNGGSNTDNYRLLVSTNSNFSTLAVDQTIADTSYTADSLSRGTTYYWKVIANNSKGSTASSPRSFETGSAGAPSISAIADQAIERNTSTGALSFTIGDTNTPLENLSILISSSNQTVIPTENIILGGSNANRTVTVTPSADTSGTSNITLAVSDGISASVSSFIVKVNNPPVISNIGDYSVSPGTSTGAISFNVSDLETAAGQLIIAATSSNTTLVPDSAIVTGGSGGGRTITITPPNTGRIGSVTITVTVSDADAASASDSFILSVGNSQPVVSSTTKNGTEDTVMAFTAADFTGAYRDAESNLLQKIKILSLPSEVLGVLNFNGHPATLNQEILNADLSKLTFNPTVDKNGASAFQWQASDGNSYSSAATITLNMVPVNDAPTIDNGSKTGSEDSVMSFSPIDFTSRYHDAENNPLRQIIVVSTPISTDPNGIVPGVLKLNGANILSGMVIQIADTANLTFVPAEGYSGTAVFSWKGSDGAVFSTTAAGLTLDIEHVNHAPTVGNLAKSGSEDSIVSFALSDFTNSYNDADGEPLSSIRITSLPANGVLKLDNEAVSTGQVIPASDIVDFKFVPGLNWSGSSSFSYRACDGAADTPAYSSPALVLINIVPVNDAPVVTNGSITINEDSALSNIDFSGRYSDAEDGHSIHSIIITALPQHGLLKLEGSNLLEGSVVEADKHSDITYIPNTLYSGTDSFKWKGSDAESYSNEGVFSITITHVNHAPTAGGFNITGSEDTTFNFTSGNFTSNFADVDSGDHLSDVTIEALPANGMLILGEDASTAPPVMVNQAIPAEDLADLKFVPGSNWNGITSFTYRASDNNSSFSGLSQVTLRILPVNDPPMVSAINNDINEDTLLAFTAADFAAAFHDVDVNMLSRIQITELPANGLLRLGGIPVVQDQEILYSQLEQLNFLPNSNWYGMTSFKWKGYDGLVYSNSANASINVLPINDVPIVSNSSKQGDEDLVMNLSSEDFTGVYADAEGQPLALVKVVQLPDPSYGILKLNGNPVTSHADIPLDSLAQLSFEPVQDWHGIAVFSWTASDGFGYSTQPAQMSLDIDAANDKPIIDTLTKNGIEDENITFAAADFGFDDSADIHQPPMEDNTFTAIQINTLPSNGTLMLGAVNVELNQVIDNAAISSLRFVPDADWNGITSFGWKAFDGLEWSPAASIVNINISALNDSPVAQNSSIALNEDTMGYSVSLLASDIERDSLTYQVVSDAQHGNLIVDTDGNFTYTPDADYNGPDSFTWKASDGSADSETYTVSITVLPLNDAPQIMDSVKSGYEDSRVLFIEGDFAISDIDGDSFANIKILTLPLKGTLRQGNRNINAGDVIQAAELGSITYEPQVLWPASGVDIDSFTWKGSDGLEYSDPATITLSITHVNHLPSAYSTSITTLEDIAVNDILASSDVDTADSMAYSIVTNGTKGTAVITNASTGEFTYTPNVNANEIDTFTFKVNDGTGNSNTATVTVHITEVNDRPVAESFALSKDEDRELYLGNEFELHYSDVETQPMSSIMITGLTSHGTLKLSDRDINTGDIIGLADIPNISYVPQEFYHGDDTFAWRSNDGAGFSNSDGTVTITVNEANHAPTLSGFMSQLTEDNTYTFDTSEFTSNFRDADIGGTAFNTLQKLKITALPQHGILKDGATEIDTVGYEITDLSTVNYVPDSDYYGIDSFTWLGFDGADYSDADAEILLNIAPVNDKPVVSASSVNGTEDIPYTFNLNDFNYTDTDGDAMSQIIVLTLPVNGTLELDHIYINEGAILSSDDVSGLSFLPDADWNGSTSFGFRVNDGSADSDNQALMTIAIAAQNDAPSVSDSDKTLAQDSQITFQTTDFSRKFLDAEGTTMAAIKVTALPEHGTFLYSGSEVEVGDEIAASDIGNLIFIANDDWYGNTSFRWMASDGTTYSAIDAAMNIEITHVNGKPVSVGSAINAVKNSEYIFTLQNFPIADRDGDSAVRIKILSLPQHGILKLNGSNVSVDGEILASNMNTFTYTPDTDYLGGDSFAWKANDGSEYSDNSAMADITVSIGDAEAVATDKAAVNVLFAPGDSAGNVTRDLTLAGTPLQGSTITWQSSDPSIVSITGRVARPGHSTGNKTVTLTAVIEKGSVRETKVFVLIIKAESAPPVEDRQHVDVEILVNGKPEDIGRATQTTEGDKSVLTVVVDPQKIEEKLKNEGNNTVLSIPVNTRSDVLIGELNGQTVKNMEMKQAVVEIKTENASYTLPAGQINIDAVSDKIGKNIELKDIKVQIEISRPLEDTVKVVENSAKTGEFTIMVPPVEFTVRCTHGDQTVEVTSFNSYVERAILVPEGVDANKITTGIIVDPDGTVRHVPTRIEIINGKYYAKINSLTNSTYSIIWNPVKFADVKGHWAKEAINDMGSRLIIDGTGNNLYSPGSYMTRGEYASILVKALGLKPGSGITPFQDVKQSDRFSGYIEAAYKYGLISGFGNGKFGPEGYISREQAMIMLSNAMKITDIQTNPEAGEIQKLLKAFKDSDKVSAWSKDEIADCVKAGIISGRAGKMLEPDKNMTRAEVAVIIRLLLQKSSLI